jgi:hypothetical protein
MPQNGVSEGWTMRISKVITALALVAVSACATIHGGEGNDDVTMNVSGNKAQALEAARTQLLHHGYQVTTVGEQMIVTTPKTVPLYLREVSTVRPQSQQWFLVVTADQMRFFRGTRVRVAGYVLPPGAGTTTAVTNGKRLQQEAIPITPSNKKLFREVQMVASWISNEAKIK